LSEHKTCKDNGIKQETHDYSFRNTFTTPRVGVTAGEGEGEASDRSSHFRFQGVLVVAMHKYFCFLLCLMVRWRSVMTNGPACRNRQLLPPAGTAIGYLSFYFLQLTQTSSSWFFHVFTQNNLLLLFPAICSLERINSNFYLRHSFV
jgi:hypothetical protein